MAAKPCRGGGQDDEHKILTGAIIAAATAEHKRLGAGLLENIYAKSLTYELGLRGIDVDRRFP